MIAKKDMTVKGSTVNAKDILLKAGNNIHILSSENKSTTIEDYKAKSGSIGASLSKGGYGIGASYGKGKGQIKETTFTHTPTEITAENNAVLSSGNDTTIKGGIIKGNKVTADIRRNLTIESEQDKKNYKETSKTSGLSISYTPGSAVTVSGGKGKTNTDSTYESVTKQAGIYAGKEGYDIQVKNNTRLKGAVIDSKAPAEKNKLTTGTLTWENIDNKAEYKTGGHGISYNGKIGRGDKNDPLDSQTNNRYGKDAITGQRNGMNKITQTIYGSKIPLNERGLLNTPIPSVKGKAGTSIGASTSPLGFSISVVKFVPLVQGIDLSDEKVRQDILSGVTFTGSVFAGIGVGAQIPIYSDYAGKVAIYLIGIGTPSVGGGIGNSESVDDKKAKIERDIQDNLYGLD